MKYFLVDIKTMESLIDYLSKRPYIEVNEGIEALLRSEQTEIDRENKETK
jgi:hypothetical protein